MTSRSLLLRLALALPLTAAVTLGVSPEARAFCGFYVGGADAKLFNNATLVVLMRDGQPVWAGHAHIQSVELGPKTGRVDLQLAFSRNLTAPERSRLRLA